MSKSKEKWIEETGGMRFSEDGEMFSRRCELIEKAKKSGNIDAAHALREGISVCLDCETCGLPAAECICPEFDS
jgi:hypothetical protein